MAALLRRMSCPGGWVFLVELCLHNVALKDLTVYNYSGVKHGVFSPLYANIVHFYLKPEPLQTVVP